VQQHHRIQTPGNRDQNPLTAPEKLSVADGLLVVFPQMAHALMLSPRPKPEQGDWKGSAGLRPGTLMGWLEFNAGAG
jgi:hypothetical protein